VRGDSSVLFGKYVNIVVDRLGDLVEYWVTINEPMVYASQSYWRRRWPPQKRNLWQMIRVINHMARAHRQAYRVIHHNKENAKVGIAKHMIAYSPNQKLANWWLNHFFYILTHGTHDYLGVNYYFSSDWDKWDGLKSDLGWPVDPEGLGHVLDQVKSYNLPIYITENGLADASDSKRADFIRSHLRAVEQAQTKGVDVRGYLHWSLLDNFEWSDGFGPRFGLVEVDYRTKERKVRPSAWAFKAVIDQAQSRE
jgi:beta-glucosidase